jgi:hypothetical protein
MSIQLPQNAGQLLELGNKMDAGLIADGAALKITQITPAELEAAIAALTNINNDYNAGRSAIQAASNAVQAANGSVATWIAAVKNALSISFGQRWNSQWTQVGFITPSIAIPPKLVDQLSLAGRMIAFFTKNPAYEVAAKGVTAAAGTALLAARTTALNTLTGLQKAQVTLDTNWTAADTALRDTMWSLIKILQGSLADNDPRWLDFGLPLPGTPSTPAQPQNVAAHGDGTGNIVVQCDPLALATRYRWRLRYVGVEVDYRLVASSTEPMASISGVLPGQMVEIIVQGVNSGLQGVASEPVLFTVPVVIAAPAGAKAEPKASIAPEAKAATNSNGNGNGHSRPNGNGNGTALHHRAA